MYEIYHSSKSGNLSAETRTKRVAAIKVAEKTVLRRGEWVTVRRDCGPMPGDFVRVYRREYVEE